MSIYEEIELEDMIFDKSEQVYNYPCPCGDKFVIGLDELWNGEDVGVCPSCTLRIRVIYEEEALPPYREDSEEEAIEPKNSWPELVGMVGMVSVDTIKNQRPDLKTVVIVQEGMMMTMDWREDRVRVTVDKEGRVKKPPATG
ncbi:hypothetical protein ScalyP_jg101 [Parmales sp. scaly parma]|nr:hypothetical protein ScalyP_jg101 [Parmales sp. scaly parma]|tara:strand:+ start:205 stop:630 length:426 start_codon:yes stop_codon:yes gene_type:complete